MKTYPNKICASCGKTYRESYGPSAELDRMIADGICFICAYWENRAEKPLPFAATTIDGCVYHPGNRTSGELRGCAGRRFDIEYFDGRRVTTFDLWVTGAIPEKYRDRMPDTARFLNGAERVQVGDTECFNPSRYAAESYPLPNGSPAPQAAARKVMD